MEALAGYESSVPNTGCVINGKRVRIPGVKCTNFLDDKRLRLSGKGMRTRRGRIQAVVVHTTLCSKTKVVAGAGPDRNMDYRVIKWWESRPTHKVGVHFTIDYDGSVGNYADLVRTTYHAGSKLNDYSIGIEVAKRKDGRIYEKQIQVFTKLAKWLCEQFSIQFQCVTPQLANTVIPRVRNGRDVVGVFAHMHVTKNKPNDPGPQIFSALVQKGFKPFTFMKRGSDYDDKAYWRPIQKKLGVTANGVPGASTVAALKKKGYTDGVYALGKLSTKILLGALGVGTAGLVYWSLKRSRSGK